LNGGAIFDFEVSESPFTSNYSSMVELLFLTINDDDTKVDEPFVQQIRFRN
jgi:hypothetical protein